VDGVNFSIDVIPQGFLALMSIGALEILTGLLLWGWHRKTRPVGADSISPKENVRRNMVVLAWLLALALVVFLSAGVLVHQDAPWYQSINPDESRLPPAFQAIVFICYPAYIVIGGAIYLYMKTYLPGMLTEVRWFLLVAVVAPFMFLPYYDAAIFDQRMTLIEGLYLAAYWLTLVLWLAVGIAPLVAKSIGAIIGSLAGRSGPQHH